MPKRWIAHPRIAVVAHDAAMVWIAWMFAHWLRYLVWEGSPALPWWPREMFWVLVVQLAVLHLTGLYRGIWRFASLPDLWNIIRACLYGTLLISLALFLLSRLEGVPRTVFIIYPASLLLLLGGPRLAYRVWKDRSLAFDPRGQRQRVLILGAGRVGDMLARDLSRESPYRPVAFVDDQRKLHGAKLRGLPILGGLEQVPELVDRHAIDVCIIAIPSASNRQMQRMVKICQQAKRPFRTVPRLQDVMSGRASFQDLKQVAIEDLLGRKPVDLDWAQIHQGLSGRVVLVTGGGGSIGAELCRQLARLGPEQLAIFDNSEHNLYQIERELRDRFPNLVSLPILGDVCDATAVAHVIEKLRPSVIFHAAAYKHVPMLQNQSREAVRNNVVGTTTVAALADRYGVGVFVLISSDKAVNPVNVMGATKRLAEILCKSLGQRSATRFVTVRFGNVLNSAGSVVPLFREQLEAGGPLTVTHPAVQRYFMTITEACQLIMQVAVMGEGGGIYVLDMGEPVLIRDLAEQMIRLSGQRPGEDIEIVYTGLRAGEKLHEELFHAEEPYRATGHSQVFLAHPRPIDQVQLQHRMAALERAVAAYDVAAVERELSLLVPEMRSVTNPTVDDQGKVIRLQKKA